MSPAISAILNWLRQPSSVTGLSALLAASVGVLSGQISEANAVPAFVFGIVAILLPDNASAQAAAQNFAASATVKSQGAAGDAVHAVAAEVAALNKVVGAAAAIAPPALQASNALSAAPSTATPERTGPVT